MSAWLSGKSDYASLLDKFDTWIFDCDGVLWHGDTLVPGSVAVLDLLRSHNKQILFVTNNASTSRRGYIAKFDKLGIKASTNEIYGSAYAAAVYISSVLKLPKHHKVYVIGQAGLEEELREEGISYLGGTDPADNTLAPFNPSATTPDPSVRAVLCGLDTSITYTKLAKALRYLLLPLDPPCHFLATNLDSTFPSPTGNLPGAGALSAVLVKAADRVPTGIGKPERTMLDCIRAKVDLDPARTLMIGDRLDTDILFGQRGGLSTLLVLTGITKESEVAGPDPSPVVPDYITRSIGDLGVLGDA